MCLLVLFKIIVLGCLFWLFSGVADLLCLWFGLGWVWVFVVFFLMWLVCNCFGEVRFADRFVGCIVCLFACAACRVVWMMYLLPAGCLRLIDLGIYWCWGWGVFACVCFGVGY